MAASHHYVPQFYFRLFSEDSKRICFLDKSNSKIMCGVKIDSQCAEDNFYGSEDIEQWISKLENQARQILVELIEVAKSDALLELTTRAHMQLLQFILFQRARTLGSYNNRKEAMGKTILHLACSDLPEFASLVQNVEVVPDQLRTILYCIESALTQHRYALDLDLVVLRNVTQRDFVFSDSPVVFHNPHLFEIKNRGVLGYQSPGLQVYYPLDNRHIVLLYDHQIYDGGFRQKYVYNVDQLSDVAQLNALQFHNSQRFVYFGRKSQADDIHRVWNAHKDYIDDCQDVMHVRNVAGKPEEKFIHSFEPQLNMKVKLSFMHHDTVLPNNYRYKRRNQPLFDLLKKQIE